MKILVSDFDKTLFDDNYFNNIAKVNEFAIDNIFVIATGRSLPQLLKEINLVNINYRYLICNDGATIYDNKLNLIRSIYINKESSNEIYNTLKEDNSVDDCFVGTVSEYTKDLSKINEVVAIIGRYNNYDNASILLNKLLEKHPSIHGYLSNYWINIIDISVTKAEAILYLINYLHLDKKDVITVGDGENDASMISEFNGYAMQCSNKELKRISIGIVESLEELIKKIKRD